MSLIQDNSANNQLRRYRQKRCLRLRDVADLMGLESAAHIAHWEKNRKLPSLINALKLSAATQCPVEVLFSQQFNRLRKDVNDKKKKHKIELKYACEKEAGDTGN